MKNLSDINIICQLPAMSTFASSWFQGVATLQASFEAAIAARDAGGAATLVSQLEAQHDEFQKRFSTAAHINNAYYKRTDNDKLPPHRLVVASAKLMLGFDDVLERYEQFLRDNGLLVVPLLRQRIQWREKMSKHEGFGLFYPWYLISDDMFSYAEECWKTGDILEANRAYKKAADCYRGWGYVPNGEAKGQLEYAIAGARIHAIILQRKQSCNDIDGVKVEEDELISFFNPELIISYSVYGHTDETVKRAVDGFGKIIDDMPSYSARFALRAADLFIKCHRFLASYDGTSQTMLRAKGYIYKLLQRSADALREQGKEFEALRVQMLEGIYRRWLAENDNEKEVASDFYSKTCDSVREKLERDKKWESIEFALESSEIRTVDKNIGLHPVDVLWRCYDDIRMITVFMLLLARRSKNESEVEKLTASLSALSEPEIERFSPFMNWYESGKRPTNVIIDASKWRLDDRSDGRRFVWIVKKKWGSNIEEKVLYNYDEFRKYRLSPEAFQRILDRYPV